MKHIQPVDPTMLSIMIRREIPTEIFMNELLRVSQRKSEHGSVGSQHQKNQGDGSSIGSFKIYSNSTTKLQRTTRSERNRKTQSTRKRNTTEIIPLKFRLIRYNTQPRRTETNRRNFH